MLVCSRAASGVRFDSVWRYRFCIWRRRPAAGAHSAGARRSSRGGVIGYALRTRDGGINAMPPNYQVKRLLERTVNHYKGAAERSPSAWMAGRS